jgi:hypothetical protein
MHRPSPFKGRKTRTRRVLQLALMSLDVPARFRIDAESAFRRDDHRAAKRRKGLSDHFLVGTGPLDLGRIEKADAALVNFSGPVAILARCMKEQLEAA